MDPGLVSLLALILAVFWAVFVENRKPKKELPTEEVEEVSWHEWMLENDVVYREIDEARRGHVQTDEEAIARIVYHSLPRVGTYEQIYSDIKRGIEDLESCSEQ